MKRTNKNQNNSVIAWEELNSTLFSIVISKHCTEFLHILATCHSHHKGAINIIKTQVPYHTSVIGKHIYITLIQQSAVLHYWKLLIEIKVKHYNVKCKHTKKALSKHLAVLDMSCFCWSRDPSFQYLMFTPWVSVLYNIKLYKLSRNFHTDSYVYVGMSNHHGRLNLPVSGAAEHPADSCHVFWNQNSSDEGVLL
jgi:hypothetical protein